jgi:cell wall-associated NlpC family hydrolase
MVVRLPSPARGQLMAGFLALAALTGAACASRGPAVPQPFPTAPTAGAASAPNPATGSEPMPVVGSMAVEGIVSTAMHLLGTRYRNGGANPEGFDCSGFVQYVFAQQGVLVPRTVEDQARFGARVDDDPRAGDLVFFHTGGRGPSHVGIALDSGRFVHAPSSRGEVRIEPLARPYWADRFIEARRMIVIAPTAPLVTQQP